MRAVLTVVVPIGVSIAVGACHRPSSPEPPSSSSALGVAIGSAGDIEFLETMVAHHQQAQLTAIVPEQSINPALLMLANQIAEQQRTELQGCQAQLLQWEAPGKSSARRDAVAGIPGMWIRPLLTSCAACTDRHSESCGCSR